MRDNNGGSIINFTSLAAETGVELLGDCAAAKEAVRGGRMEGGELASSTRVQHGPLRAVSA